MRRWLATLAIGLLAVAPLPALAAPFTMDTIPPDGIVGASPGGTLGWGYTITNPDPDNWLDLVGANIAVLLAGDIGDIASGSADGTIFDFPLILPGATVSVPWVLGVQGLYEFAWTALATVGHSVTVDFSVDWAQFVDDDNNVVEEATVDGFAGAANVLAPSQAAVPEPSPVVLLGFAVLGLLALTRRYRRRPTSSWPTPS